MAFPAVARFVVEVRFHGKGVAGTVAPDAGRAAPFSGWLELLALLEDPTAHGAPTVPVPRSAVEIDQQ